jgi:hypothetical protein
MRTDKLAIAWLANDDSIPHDDASPHDRDDWRSHGFHAFEHATGAWILGVERVFSHHPPQLRIDDYEVRVGTRRNHSLSRV